MFVLSEATKIQSGRELYNRTDQKHSGLLEKLRGVVHVKITDNVLLNEHKLF